MRTFIVDNLIAFVSVSISIISLSISLFIALRSLYVERFSIDFDLVKWFAASSVEWPFFIWLTVQNNSKLPVSILEIELVLIRNKKITAKGSGNKKHVTTINYGQEDKEKVYSIDYPLFIDSYGSTGGYFHVFSDSHFGAFEDCDINVKLITNRGTKKKRFNFDFGKNIYRVWQFNQGDFQIDKHSDGSKIEYMKDWNL